MRPKHTSHAARYAAALLFILLALPSMRTTASSALHGFLGSAVALPFGVGKWASLGLFALQVLVDGNAAPVDGREPLATLTGSKALTHTLLLSTHLRF